MYTAAPLVLNLRNQLFQSWLKVSFVPLRRAFAIFGNLNKNGKKSENKKYNFLYINDTLSSVNNTFNTQNVF